MGGNNRTALAAAVCLCLNGYHLADTDDVESFFGVAPGVKRTVEDIEAWLNIRQSH
jgi:prophage maintenance system killer protein